MTNVETFVKGLSELNIKLTNEKIEKFRLYKKLLKEWNEKINITAITDDDEIDIKHFLDSLAIFETGIVVGGKSVIDVGTGGGFPGIPIKIVSEDVNVTLLDSLNKRLLFLDEVINQLGLSGIESIHGRAEDLGKSVEHREKYDIATSRAVASLNVLCEYCIPFVKVNGYFIALKGPEVDEELREAQNAIKVLGGKLENKINVHLPNSDIVHNLIVIKKISQTPTKYPRAAGKPKKNPL